MSKIGKTLVVQHATNGQGEYRKCKEIRRIIKAEYTDGRVMDSAGEPWHVRKGDDGRYYTQMR